MVTTLLSKSDAQAVEAAVTRVETKTAAEVVVAVVPQSADHWQGRVALAVTWALAAGLAFLVWQPAEEPVWALAIQALVGSAAFALAGFRPLLRLLVSKSAAEGAARARAFQLFAERGLHGTQNRTALLIFVSELEHQVVLLGDHSIDGELGQAGWDAHVAQLLGRIRQGQTREGLLELLARLEPQLAAVAPRSPDDVNELPDALLRA